MEKIITELEILRAEHEILHEANVEWLGLNRETAMDDVQYVSGVVDLATKLLLVARGEDE